MAKHILDRESFPLDFATSCQTQMFEPKAKVGEAEKAKSVPLVALLFQVDWFDIFCKLWADKNHCVQCDQFSDEVEPRCLHV